VIGLAGAAAAYTLLGDWRAPALRPAKDRDFATSLGPLVVTAEELGEELVLRVDGEESGRARVDVNWDELLATAAERTELRPGDLVASPTIARADAPPGASIEVELGGIGLLRSRSSAGEDGDRGEKERTR